MPRKQKERSDIAYKNLSDCYQVKKENFFDEPFQKQYYFLYRARIKFLYDRILENAKKTIGKHYFYKNRIFKPNPYCSFREPHSSITIGRFNQRR